MNILVIGSSNTDLTVHAPSMPKPGETVLGGHFEVNAGGKGANQAVGAVRLGADVTFSCMLGEDAYGRESRERFASEGMDVSYVFSCPDCASGVALITVDGKGENCIVVAGGANLRFRPCDVDRIGDFSRYSIVLTQLEIPFETVEHIAGLCSRFSVPLVLNPAPARPLPESLLRNVFLITPNETEAEILTGIAVKDVESARRAAMALVDMGVGSVIITMGGRGAYVYSGGEGRLVPAFKVKAVDTTAAGDVFNGALCAAMAGGTDIAGAVRFASAASAIAVTRSGAQNSVPYYDEVVEFLKNNQI